MRLARGTILNHSGRERVTEQRCGQKQNAIAIATIVHRHCEQGVTPTKRFITRVNAVHKLNWSNQKEQRQSQNNMWHPARMHIAEFRFHSEAKPPIKRMSVQTVFNKSAGKGEHFLQFSLDCLQ